MRRFLFTFLNYSYSEKFSICLNYSLVFTSGYLAKQELKLDKQFGITFNINDNFLILQYFKINNYNIYSISIGLTFWTKEYENSLIDRLKIYGALGFVNTSFANKIYQDTNYPDAVIGVLVDKYIGTLGISYCYFNGFRFNIGCNF